MANKPNYYIYTNLSKVYYKIFYPQKWKNIGSFECFFLNVLIWIMGFLKHWNFYDFLSRYKNKEKHVFRTAPVTWKILVSGQFTTFKANKSLSWVTNTYYSSQSALTTPINNVGIIAYHLKKGLLP